MTDLLQLYSLATPNGQKVSIALEEMGLQYEAHRIDIGKGEQFSEEFIKYNPNSKIPALVDPAGDHGKPLAIMESGAILIYLAEKSNLFLPSDIASRSRVLQWLFWQVGGTGPMFGQYGHFAVNAKDPRDLTYAIERYTKEAKRLLQVLNHQLSQYEYIAGDLLSIADFANYPWVICLDRFYKARDALDLDQLEHVTRWVNTISERPAVIRGMDVCSINPNS